MYSLTETKNWILGRIANEENVLVVGEDKLACSDLLTEIASAKVDLRDTVVVYAVIGKDDAALPWNVLGFEIRESDYFLRLIDSPQASPEEVRQKWFRAALKWRPDCLIIDGADDPALLEDTARKYYQANAETHIVVSADPSLIPKLSASAVAQFDWAVVWCKDGEGFIFMPMETFLGGSNPDPGFSYLSNYAAVRNVQLNRLAERNGGGLLTQTISLSTAHISPMSSEWLTREIDQAQYMTVYDKEGYGFNVFVDTGCGIEEITGNEEIPEDIREAVGFAEEYLRARIGEAPKHFWLDFDGDAPNVSPYLEDFQEAWHTYYNG